MQKLNREEGVKKWQEYWDELKEEWFKVEVLQDYSGEDDGPSLQAWVSGDRQKSIELLQEEARNNEWVKLLQAKPKVKKIRLHVVDEPLTPYLEWELQAYKHINIPLGGEKIYLVPKKRVSHLPLPDGDFMIFDNKKVIKNMYSPKGRVTAYDVYEAGDDISNFLKLKGELLRRKKSLK